jgi:hypothetical protein
MNRFTRAIPILLCLALGIQLIVIPWLDLWERNYFLERYPQLIPVLLNPFLRGAVTGLGLLDVWIAAGWMFSRPRRKSRA